MIYTIKCRRNCGASHESTVNPDHLESKAQLQGWRLDGDGWLCPFDASKPAAKPVDRNIVAATICLGAGCCNSSTAIAPAVLKSNGWHSHANQWYCPACWKTTQSEPETEPGPTQEECEWSIDQIEGIARRVALDEVRQAFGRLKRNAND